MPPLLLLLLSFEVPFRSACGIIDSTP